MKKPLTQQELELIQSFLEDYSDSLSNNGCNDFPMDNTDENWELHEKVEDRNETEEEDRSPRPPKGKKIYFYDWGLCSYLASRVGDELDANLGNSNEAKA